MNESHGNNFEVIITLLFLLIIIAAIFIVDFITPKGYLDWFCYLVVIFYSSLKLPRKYLLIFGYAGIGLTIAGYFISPDGVAPEFALINRIIGILIIWMLASLLYKQGKEWEQKNEIEKQLSLFLTKISTSGIVYFDTDGKIITTNKKFANILGYREDEIIGKNILEFTHPNSIGSFLISKEKIYLNLLNSDFLEEKLIKKNKEVELVNVTLNITQNVPNDARLFIAYFRSIKREEETVNFITGNKILLKETSG